MSSGPWWSNKWGKDKICGISHTRLRQGKNANGVYHTTELKCGHRFNTNSLLEWMKVYNNQTRTTCPMCRAVFNINEIIRK